MRTKTVLNKVFAIAILLLVSVPAIGQFSIPEIPKDKNQRIVYDEIKLLTDYQKSALTTKLKTYADSTSTQIVLAIISSSNGEDLSLLGAQWGNKWGIGQANEDNGILILLARNDRRIDINTGYGIEYRMTDLMTERIINREILPHFKDGNYYLGLDAGVDGIFKALNGEFKEERTFIDIPWGTILFLLYILILIIISFTARGGGSGGGYSSYPSRGYSSGGYTSSSSSSSSSGGFSGGFGGGSFGGGGASGSW